MRRVGGQQNFDLLAKRRKEIVLHAFHVGAMDTEDRSRWLIAWVWHNRKATDQIWSVMEAAKRMGGQICEAEAAAITEEASITRKHLSADSLARFLGVTYAQRQALGLTTIGSVDVGKSARRVLRKRRDRTAKERKRRALGMRPQLKSLSATKPWEAEGMSRAVWYRQNKARRKRETTLSAALFLSCDDKTVSPKREERPSEGRFAPKEERGLPSSQTATTMAVDRLESLPVGKFGSRGMMWRSFCDQRKERLPMTHDAELTVAPPTTEIARSAVAKRMRLHRERRRQGLRCLMIEVRDTEIDALVGMGLLGAEMRNDADAIIDALYAHFGETLGEIA